MSAATGGGPGGVRGWFERHAATLVIAVVVVLGGFVFPAMVQSGSDVAVYTVGVVIPVAGAFGAVAIGVRVARRDADADAAYAADPTAASPPRTPGQRRAGWLFLTGAALFFVSTIPVVLTVAGR